MIFAVTLWSPAQDLFNEIEQDILSFHKINESTTYELTNEEYSKLVRDIYSCDDIAPEKIEIKLSHMNRPKNLVRYLLVDFEDPRFRSKKSTGLPLSMTGEDLKSFIRSKYKSKIKGYFPDIIIHTCDNYLQTDYVRGVFSALDQNFTQSYEMSRFIGKTITSIEGAEQNSKQIKFNLDNGDHILMLHYQDCCEDVYVEDVNGNVQDLVGSPILIAEAVTKRGGNNGDSETWTYYKFATNNGYVTIRWYGVSNGYYSEEVSVEYVESTETV